MNRTSLVRSGLLINLCTALLSQAESRWPSAPVGFASVNALGQNGTSGGAGGGTTTVSNAAQFLAVLAQEGPRVIQVQGLIELPGKMHQVTSRKTILGLGRSGIAGAGLNIQGASNIILQNLIFTNAPADAINIASSSHHVWVDHCDLSAAFDGLIDIKRGSDFVTVSWNHFHHHDKTMLLGHSDRNEAEDNGHLRVTYHHNWFDGTGQRHPRVRFGEPVHVFNNYYRGLGQYGVAAQMNSGVVIEGNYFENVSRPTRNDITKDPLPGRIVERSNVFVQCGPPVSFGKVIEPATYYRYTLDPAAQVKSLVLEGAGIRR